MDFCWYLSWKPNNWGLWVLQVFFFVPVLIRLLQVFGRKCWLPWHSQLPQLPQTCTDCISPDSQTVLHHTPHFEILPPGTDERPPWWQAAGWAEKHGVRLEIWNFKKDATSNIHSRPNLQIHGANLTLDIIWYNGAPHGAPWETPLEWSNEHMIYINRIKYVYIYTYFGFRNLETKRMISTWGRWTSPIISGCSRFGGYTGCPKTIRIAVKMTWKWWIFVGRPSSFTSVAGQH